LFGGRVRKLKELKVLGEYSDLLPDWDLVLYDGLEGSAHLFDGKRITLPVQVPPMFYRAHTVEADQWRAKASESTGTPYANYNATQAELVKEFELALLRKATAVLSASDRAATRFREVLPRIQQYVVPAAYSFVDVGLQRAPIPGRFLCVVDHNIPGDREAVRRFLREVWPEVIERAPEKELVLLEKGGRKGLSRFRRRSGLTLCPWKKDSIEEFVKCEALLILGGEAPVLRGEVIEAAAHKCPIISSSEGVGAFALKAGEHFEKIESFIEWMSRLTEQHRTEHEALGERLFEVLSERHNPAAVANRFIDAVCAELESPDEEGEANSSSAV
jgi:glycosyltransferase involved in cell wall biosynthesis